MSSAALPAPRTAASTTAAGSPAKVTIERFCSASIDQSRRCTPSTRMEATMASTRRGSEPSEKLGTHSTTGPFISSQLSAFSSQLQLSGAPGRLKAEGQLLVSLPPGIAGLDLYACIDA